MRWSIYGSATGCFGSRLCENVNIAGHDRSILQVMFLLLRYVVLAKRQNRVFTQPRSAAGIRMTSHCDR